MLPCIMGMVLSGLVILFNEPLARFSTALYHKVFGTPITNSLIHRTKISFIIYGTLFMLISAVILKVLWFA